MDVNTIMLLIMAFVMVLCLFATVAYLLYYVGIFYDVKVTVGKPTIGNVWIAYKNYSGPYEKCGPHFTEICSLCPKLDSIGIFYDDPNSVCFSCYIICFRIIVQFRIISKYYFYDYKIFLEV